MSTITHQQDVERFEAMRLPAKSSKLRANKIKNRSERLAECQMKLREQCSPRVLCSLLFCIAQLLALPSLNAQASDLSEGLPLLTNVAQVRALSSEQTGRGYPVRLNGVVIYYDAKTRNDLIIHDSTGSVYVDIRNEQRPLKPGDLVELHGQSASGDYAPIVLNSRLDVLGRGEIPPPRLISFEELATGAEDGQWVEVRGIVRSAAVERPRDRDNHEYLMVKLASGGGQFVARLLDFDPSLIEQLPDSEVSVSGVCIPIFNRKRQLVNISLMVPGMDCLRMTKKAPKNPFDENASLINSLLQFDPQRLRGHRVKVAGEVTFQRLGEFLFIRDETQGLQVRTRQNTHVAIGDRVEVLGFPALGEYTPVLEDAIFRKVGAAAPLKPIHLAVDTAREGDYDADLIQVEADFTDYVRRANELVLVLRDKEFIFNAHLDTVNQESSLESLPKGSRVRLTGICQVQLGNQRWPQSFRLLLRSPSDVVMIKAPSWWTLKRTLWILAMVTVFFSVALGVVVSHAKAKVRQQIRDRRETEAQFTAVNQERNRLAGELHDTLEQGLTGILLQAEAAAETLSSAPQGARRHLDFVQKLANQTQDEVRRSVWDLRSQMLDNNDLASALDAVGKQLCDGPDVRVSVESLGVSQRLPERIENNLLRIGQEAITNAVRHASARNILVQVRIQSNVVKMSVRDDGKGFATNPLGAPQPGHFGLMGMRERAKKLRGKISIDSAAGSGSSVSVEIPLDG